MEHLIPWGWSIGNCVWTLLFGLACGMAWHAPGGSDDLSGCEEQFQRMLAAEREERDER